MCKSNSGSQEMNPFEAVLAKAQEDRITKEEVRAEWMENRRREMQEDMRFLERRVDRRKSSRVQLIDPESLKIAMQDLDLGRFCREQDIPFLSAKKMKEGKIVALSAAITEQLVERFGTKILKKGD